MNSGPVRVCSIVFDCIIVHCLCIKLTIQVLKSSSLNDLGEIHMEHKKIRERAIIMLYNFCPIPFLIMK